MAKLLIIDDHTEMVRLLQQQMEALNPRFTEQNTFYFSDSGDKFRICSMKEGRCDQGRVSMSGKKEQVFKQVFDFLVENRKEQVLILIDVLLNSANISAPSYERYRADEEYSCELYAELMRMKNRKPQENNVSPENFFFVIYSRSEASIGVVVSVLSSLPKDKELFPEECCLRENISWCKNKCDTTDENYRVAPTDKNEKNPLALPKAYQEFFKEMR